MIYSQPDKNPARTIENLTGIGNKLARKIIEELGEGVPEVALGRIERNPYSLTDVEGIGWVKADRIALNDYGIEQDDVRRHHAGNRAILEQAGVVTEREFVGERIKKNLYDPAHKLASVELEHGRVWLPAELQAERGLARWMAGLSPLSHVPALSESHQAICDDMRLDEVQSAAVAAALSTPVLVLTGGAGCGKTYVIAALARCLLSDRQTMRGMAFAGKAADRMREAFDAANVQVEASTIHRGLGYHPRTGFSPDVIAENLVVLDESSMLPNLLLWEVVKRLNGARLVLVGDDGQLPPIGYGTPFGDLIAHGAARVHLSRNYRQVGQQGILNLAQGIRNCERVAADPACVELRFGVDGTESDTTFDALISDQRSLGFDSWQCISWRNEEVERYNLRAQAILNPDADGLFEYPCWKLGTVPGTRRPAVLAEVREGDKIIIIKNNATLNIFNGQTGRAEQIVNRPSIISRSVLCSSPEFAAQWRGTPEGLAALIARGSAQWIELAGPVEQHLRVTISGRDVHIPLSDVEKYVQLGYVITVHKAQGSDWDRVIIMQPGKVRAEMAKRFFYTASTRAKTRLTIVSSLRPVAWWTNAACDAPDVPSSLIERIRQSGSSNLGAVS